MGIGGAVTEVYVSVPRSEPSGATAVTMRHGVPVSDALRNDRPSHVPAYLCAGPADVDVRDPSPGAHAARTMAVQSSVRMCRLRYVSRMEYERSDGPTQGSALGTSRRQARRPSSQPATAANTTYAPSAVTAAAPSLDGGGPKNTNAWTTSITMPNTGIPYRPRWVVAVVDRRYRNIPPNSTATSSRNAGAGSLELPCPGVPARGRGAVRRDVPVSAVHHGNDPSRSVWDAGVRHGDARRPGVRVLRPATVERSGGRDHGDRLVRAVRRGRRLARAPARLTAARPRFLVSGRPSAHTPSSIHTGGGTCGHCFAPPSSWLRAHRVMGRARPRPPGRRTSMPGPGKAGRSGARRTPGRRGAS